MELALANLVDHGSAFLWALVRIAAFVMAAPMFGADMVPSRIKIAMAVTLSAVVSPMIGPVPQLTEFSAAWLPLLAEQVMLGAMLGFVTHMFFQLFAVAGQFTAMQTGLGFASLVDPSNGVSVAVLGQFYLMLATVTFAVMNGHLILIQVLVDSFTAAPILATPAMSDIFWNVVSYARWMFMGAFVLALPAVASLLLVNLAFGVMTRAAPQLNVFSLGFPIGLSLGLVIVWITLAEWVSRFTDILDQFSWFLTNLLG